MSEFQVTPEHIVSSTRPMHGISTQLADSHAQIGSHSDAGAGTTGAGAVQSVFDVWSTALPQYGDACDRLIQSMTLSAAGYTNTDTAIGEQSTAGASS